MLDFVVDFYVINICFLRSEVVPDQIISRPPRGVPAPAENITRTTEQEFE